MRRLRRQRKRHSIPLYAAVIIIIAAIFTGGSLGVMGANLISGLYFAENTPVSAATDSGDNITAPEKTAVENTDVNNIINDIKEKPKNPVPVSNLPSSFKNFFSQVLVNRKPALIYKRSYDVTFSGPGEYSALEGITCFRGSNYRENASYGTANVRLGKLEKVWNVKNGYIDIWTGTGWNGQPAIVKWSPEVKKIMNINSVKKRKENLKEVIYATLDGKIYFLDLDDGKPTRAPIDVGSPHKGSVVIDPRGYPLLYAGQGIPEKAGKPIPIGYRIFNLINQKQLLFINGMDPDTFRYWGAFDSGAMIDAKTDTFIECGENGILYTGKLNTNFQPDKGTISIKPDLVKYRYRSPISTKIGMENSPAIYKNYIYFADNNGLFQCIDLNTLKPVWIRNVTDDTDSTTAIEESEDGVFLYTACEVDHQGKGGASYIRKLNAFTGELLWEKKVPCFYDSHTNGGALASPVLGKGDIQDVVVYNIAKTGKINNESTLLALDRKTGKVFWNVQLKYYCWSSPVAIYTKEGKSYLAVCDSQGYMTLYEGITGKKLDSVYLGANIEASPAVYDDMIVVGTRGCRIWGIRIK